MSEIKELLEYDFKYLFLGFCLILIVGKTIWITLEWLLIEKLGLETKKQKEVREGKKLLSETSKLAKSTAEGLEKLKDRHTKDEKEFRERLDGYIEGGQEDRQKINSLIVAQKEMLAEKINEKYKYYLSIKGIPEDEYDEFVSLHTAYNGVGGNHHGDAKFEYCITHLPIIPVETKLIYNEEQKYIKG